MEKNESDNKIEINEISKNKEKNKYEKEEEGISVKEAFIQVSRRIQIYQLWIMSAILQIISFTISNTYRSFTQQSLMQEHFLSNLTKTYSFLSGISRLIWGYLFDKFTFKSLYSICITTQAIVDSTLNDSVHYPIFFSFCCVFKELLFLGKYN